MQYGFNPCPTTAVHFLRQVSLFKATGKTKDDSNKPVRDFLNKAVPSLIEKIANVYVFRCLLENSLQLYRYLFSYMFLLDSLLAELSRRHQGAAFSTLRNSSRL